MPAFRIRPRAPRPARGVQSLAYPRGSQATTGTCTLASGTGDLHATGRQATRGRAVAGGALGAIGQQATTSRITPALVLKGGQATTGRAGAGGVRAVGRQGTRALVTPGILCFGKQTTRGQVALGVVPAGAYANGYAARALVELPPQPDLTGTVVDLPFRLPADVLAAAELRAAPGLDPGASSAARPFAATAPWNVPATLLPRHPNSTALCAMLWNGASDHAGNLNIEYKDYSFPVYYAVAGTDPHATLPLANDNYTVVAADTTSNIHNTLIPWNSAWAIPAGTDGQVIVLDPTTGQSWNLWQIVVHTATKIINISKGSVGTDYRTGNGQRLTSRGTGLDYFAMLPMPWEVAQGRVDHALPMSCINVSKSGGFVGPAIKTDGDLFGVDPGIPEGTRFVWDFTDAQREAWVATKAVGARTAARVLANALREYGGVITDHAGAWQIQLADRLSHGAAWDALGLTDTVATRDLFDGLATAGNFHAVAPSPYPATDGLLQSFAGGLPLDVRLEAYDPTQPQASGPKLDHDLIGWGAGALDLRFRVPSWAVATTAYRAWLYVGKAGLVASEASPGGLWLAATRTARFDTGADLSGRGKDFTVSGGTPTTLAGLPALSMSGVDRLQRALVAAEPGLQGLTQATSEFILQLTAPVPATADGSLDRVGPQQQGGARMAGWMFPTLAWHAGNNWFAGGSQTSSDGSTADNVVDGNLTHLFLTRQSGQVPAIRVNETDLATTGSATPATGIINVEAGDYHELGASVWGSRRTTTPGVYALYVLWPAVLSPAFMALRHRSEIEGRSVAAMGAFDRFGDADQSPVAAPWRTTNDGNQTDYDVVSRAFDPDGDPITLVTAPPPGPSSHAGDAVSAVGGKVRYKPAASFVGTAEVPFTIGDGRGKSSSSRLWLAVSGTIVTPAGDYPDYALPAAVGTRTVSNAAELAAAVSGATQVPDGWHIVLAAGSSFGSLTITRNVASPRYIVIKCEKHDQLAGAAATATGLLADFTGNIVVSGQGWVIKGVNFVPGSTTSTRFNCRASRVRLTRFRIVDTATRDRQVECDASGPITGCIVDRFTIGNRYANGFVVDGNNDNLITVSWFDIYGGQGQDIGNNTGHQPLFLGTNSGQHKYRHADVALGLIRDDIGNFELKGSKMTVDRVTMRNASGFAFRHGFSNLAKGLYLTGCNATKMRDRENVFLSCVFANSGQDHALEAREGNFNPDDYYPDMPNQTQLGITPRPATMRGKFIDCSFDKLIQLGTLNDSAENPGGSEHTPCTDVLLAKCTVAGGAITAAPSTGKVVYPSGTGHVAGTTVTQTIPSGYAHVDTQPLSPGDTGWNTPAHAGDGGAMP